MAVDYTTTELVAGIKRRGFIPTTDEAFSTADFLAFATEEMHSYVVPLVMSTRGGYWLADYEWSTTAGTATYPTPPRAIGDKLEALFIGDSSGVYVPLTPIDLEEAHYVTQPSGSGTPARWYLKDSKITLVPTPTGGDLMRAVYFRRPNKLVLPAAVATIQAIDVARNTITTTATIPATITSGVTLDVVSHVPPFKWTTIDAVATTGTTGTTIELTGTLPSDVVAGNYVCLAGESPVPQIPFELFPLLQQRTNFTIRAAFGDPAGEKADQVCERMAKRALALLTPRVEGSRVFIVNRDGPGFGSVVR